jgi:succinate dehydrogenase flavin-adding protein (antitoxin of CptAB toxin-antitoxin module)
MLSLARRFCSGGGVLPKYFVLAEEEGVLRRQLAYRANNMGMKELDLLVGKFADLHLGQMGREQLLRFNLEVLAPETPEVYKMVMGQAECQGEMVRRLREFALDRGFVRATAR